VCEQHSAEAPNKVSRKQNN